METYKYEGEQQNECQENNLSRCTTILDSLEPGRLFLVKAFTYLAENFLTSREFVEVSSTLPLGPASALYLIHN
jgi:hypothetical protein